MVGIARLADKLPMGGQQGVDFHRPLVSWGLIIDVSVHIHVDIHPNWVGLLLHNVAKESRTAGQEGYSAHDAEGQPEVCQHGSTDAGPIQGQMLAQDV